MVDDFDVWFLVQWRHYRYTVLNIVWSSLFITCIVWYVLELFDLVIMCFGCDAFVGEHDFTLFCCKFWFGARDAELGLFLMVWRVLLVEWYDLGDGVLRFDVWVTAFCY